MIHSTTYFPLILTIFIICSIWLVHKFNFTRIYVIGRCLKCPRYACTSSCVPRELNPCSVLLTLGSVHWGAAKFRNCFNTNQMSQTLIFSWQNMSINIFYRQIFESSKSYLVVNDQSFFLLVLHLSIVIANTCPPCRISPRRTQKMFCYRMFNWFKLDTVRNQFSNRTTRSHFQPLSLETNSYHVFYLRTWHILQLAPFTCSHQHIIMGGMKTSITLTGSAFSILQLLAEG